MKIGDVVSEKELDELSKEAKQVTIGMGYKVLDKDMKFEEVGDKKWQLVSTREQRIKDIDTGHAFVHRKESKYTKSYYESKN